MAKLLGAPVFEAHDKWISYLYRLFVITVSILVLIGQFASASPNEDATYLAQQTLSDEALESIRKLQQPRIVRAYEDYLAELGVGIADHDRFVAMLPDSITDESIDVVLQKIKAFYLELFTADQLVEIAAFHRTDLGQKLLNASEEQPPQGYDDSKGGARLPGIYAHEQSYLASFLTPEELKVFDAFLESDAGKALNENTQGLAQKIGFAIIGGVIEFSLEEPHMDTNSSYIMEILEADGVIRFPNRIWRKDLIEKLRSDLQ